VPADGLNASQLEPISLSTVEDLLQLIVCTEDALMRLLGISFNAAVLQSVLWLA